MKASCLCLAEEMALLVAKQYIKNNAVPTWGALSNYTGWLYPCTAVFHSGLHPAVLAALEEAWGISVVYNLKFIYASKCLQDIPAKAGTFKPVSACPESRGLQLLLNVHMGSPPPDLPDTRWFWRNFCSGRASKQSFPSLTQLVGVFPNNLLMVWENKLLIKFIDQSH